MVDKIYSNYTVHYNYGMHDLNLDVYHYEFDRVLEHLSQEFKIFTEIETWDSNDYPDCVCVQTYYFINDYCGNKYKVADSFERKLK